MIDLRKEFADLMEKHGYWAVLRGRISGRKCSCWNPQTHEANPSCQKCLGTGEAFLDRFVKVRRMSLIDSPEEPSSLGREASPLVRMWMHHNMKPDVHDFIAEIAQDPESLLRGSQIQPKVPFLITKFYDIQEVEPMREMGGRVEFWRLLLEEAHLGDTT